MYSPQGKKWVPLQEGSNSSRGRPGTNGWEVGMGQGRGAGEELEQGGGARLP